MNLRFDYNEVGNVVIKKIITKGTSENIDMTLFFLCSLYTMLIESTRHCGCDIFLGMFTKAV